jgi:hypothetical protein
VIDHGVNLLNLTLPSTDQRGFQRIVNNTVDIGSTEFQPPATTTMISASTPIVYGMPLTFTANVAAVVPGNPVTGTVTFSIDGTSVGTASVMNGMATLTITPTLATLTPGAHVLTAAYGGDADFDPSTATQPLTAPLPSTTTTLALSGMVTYGQPLTLTATVATPLSGTSITGMVTFDLDGKALGMAAVTGGVATLTITPTPATLTPGSHMLTAAYGGSTTLAASTSTPVSITPALPHLTTRLTRSHNRFILQVLNNGQMVQQFTLNTQPLIQTRALNGDTVPDLVISIKQRRQFVVFAAFSGATGQRIV